MMPCHVSVVVSEPTGERAFPDWLVPGVLMLRWLQARGRLAEVEQRLRIERQGGYTGYDVFLWLVLYFGARRLEALDRFDGRLAPHRAALAALFGRRSLPTASSVSRLLAAVTPALVDTLGPWLLGVLPEADALLGHPSTAHRDTLGEAWRLFDWDPTVDTARQRALPRGPDLPEPRRRSGEMAPGYSGRKRGDCQMSRSTLQCAGSSLWLDARIAPGNGDHRVWVLAALRTLTDLAARCGLVTSRMVARADGAGGNVPFLTACQEAGIRGVTRMARYELLDRPEVARDLLQGPWYRVPSSGSGPERTAHDLGEWSLTPGSETRRLDTGARFEAVEARLVVTRYRMQATSAEDERGDGIVRDRWHYELFATTLPPEAWPAAEVAALYLGRSAIENRFHQEDRLLGLGHVFSYHLPGQNLATLIGLFVWNFEIARGFELEAPPADLPEQPRTEASEPAEAVACAAAAPVASCVPGSAAGPDIDAAPVGADGPPPMPNADDAPEDAPEDASARAAAPPVATVPESTPPRPDRVVKRRDTRRDTREDAPFRELRERIDALDPKRRPADEGWGWDSERGGPTCPAGHFCGPDTVVQDRGPQRRLRFVPPAGMCRGCPLRDRCAKTRDPRFKKRVSIPIEPADEARLRHLLKATTKTRARLRFETRQAQHPGPSPVSPANSPIPPTGPRRLRRALALACGLFAATPAALLPAVLRNAFRDACEPIRATARITSAPPAPPRVRCYHYTAAERQHRRQTWKEREKWNALPPGTEVHLTVLAPNARWRLPGIEPSPVPPGASVMIS